MGSKKSPCALVADVDREKAYPFEPEGLPRWLRGSICGQGAYVLLVPAGMPLLAARRTSILMMIPDSFIIGVIQLGATRRVSAGK
jgi:hypothetical protein